MGGYEDGFFRALKFLIMLERSIFLIGYRATGKSTVGRIVADTLSIPFYDMDSVIQEDQGASVKEIVQAGGWERFREVERRVLKDLMSIKQPVVVACGGGAVLHGDLFETIMRSSVSVWLKADMDTILDRLSRDEATERLRPSLKDFMDTKEEVASILNERLHLYKKFSQFEIDTTCKKPSELSAEIVEKVRQGVK